MLTLSKEFEKQAKATSQVVSKLIAENQRLRAENKRLHKILGDHEIPLPNAAPLAPLDQIIPPLRGDLGGSGS